MKPSLIAGIKHAQSVRVDDSLTVPRVSPHYTAFADMPPVFATAMMVGFMEWACIEALKPHLDDGEQTVGTKVDMTHLAATPVGLTATAEVELIAVEGRKLKFKVTCRDDREVIGEG